MTDAKKYTFSRGLDDARCAKVKKFITEHEAGKALVDRESGFQMFIRDGHVHFYWRGCRGLEYNPEGKKMRFKIHRRYVGLNYSRGQDEEGKEKEDYVALQPEGNDLILMDEGPTKKSWGFTKEVIGDREKTFKDFVEGEKKALYEYTSSSAISSAMPLIDLEIAFSAPNTNKEAKTKTVGKRIDLAQVVKLGAPDSPDWRLRFVEAKLDTNTALRANGEPKILQQMQEYRDFLESCKAEICDSYRRIAENMVKLGFKKRYNDLQGLTPERIDTKPVLLVFQTKDWNPTDDGHHQRLCDELGSNRVEVWDTRTKQMRAS